MLDAVVLLGALGVVEAVERAYQIPGDAADAVELHRREPVMDADVLAIDVKRQRLQLPVGVLVVGALDIGLDLVVGRRGRRWPERSSRPPSRRRSSCSP